MRIPGEVRDTVLPRCVLLAVCVALTPIAALSIAGCGKEGPPLPPLRLVPAPAGQVAARRVASQIELRFVLPTQNQNGPGRIDLDRIEIFAATIAPGATPLPNRDLMSKERLVGTIAVQPAPEEGEPATKDPADKRPAPGDAHVFVEELTAEKMTPVTPAADQTGLVDPASAKDPKAPEPPKETYAQRIYAIRGVTKGGRPGPPAPRVSVPLVDPPPAPGHVDVKWTERAFIVSWLPPVTVPGEPPTTFNVFAQGDAGVPLNGSPIDGTEYQHTPVRFGDKQCFAVKSLKVVQNVPIESAPSEEKCVVANDIFPPAPPQGLRLAAGTESISLSWDANKEPDLAGYIVLRAEGTDETFQPITPQPIGDTNYRDTAVKPGVTYSYVLQAVDTATPPNVSERSAIERATAR